MDKTYFQDLKHQLNDAIEHDGGLAVFQYYGFEPSAKAQKTNPFRDERTSSFFVVEKFGKIIFKDFGEDTYKGDCRKFVQFYEQVDYKEAFKILCQIYNLDNFEIKLKAKPLQKKTKKSKEKPFNKKLIEVQFKDFTKEELEFWQAKGEIDLKTLETNKVKSLKSFKIQISENKTKTYNNLSFVFGYEIVPQKAYKLYMPKENYRVYAKAKTVFLPNLEPARKVFGEDFTYSFGTDTVNQEKSIILCGGEPDCLALKAKGYNAFTLGDERSSIKNGFIARLLNGSMLEFLNGYQNTQQFDNKTIQPFNHKTIKPYNHKTIQQFNLKILYDTDFTGLKNGHKLAKQLNCPQIILPKLAKQRSPQHSKPRYNDVCDYITLYGFDEELQIALAQEKFKNQEYELAKTPTFEVEKYLSEKSNILAKFIQKYKRIQIDADAGVGKTYTLLQEMPKLLDKPILFAVPFAIQVEQIEQEYGNDDIVCFSNKSTKIDEEELALLGRPVGKVNVCTYDRIEKVFEHIQKETEDIMVVIDESHLLTSEYGYRSRAIQDVLNISHKASKVVYLSATPDYTLAKFSGFKLIRFKRQINPKINISAVDYYGEAKKALLKLIISPQKPPTPKGRKESNIVVQPYKHLPNHQQPLNTDHRLQTTIIRLNNKTLAKVIANLLIHKGLYQEGEIDFVFSEKRNGQTTPSKESIIQHSEIPKEVKLLFVTSTFDCGINVLNENIKEIIYFESKYTDNCKDTFKQVVARFRNLQEVNITVCKPARYQDLKRGLSAAKLYERLEKDAKNKLALLPYADENFRENLETQIQTIENFGLTSAKTPKYIKANRDISATYKLLSKNQEGNYIVNYNYIRFSLKEYSYKCLNSKNFYTDLVNELPNTFLADRTKLITDKREQGNQELKVLLGQEKELKKERVHIICKLIKEKPQEFFDAVQAEYKDVSLKKKIKDIFVVSKKKDAPKLEELIKQAPNPKREEEQPPTPKGSKEETFSPTGKSRFSVHNFDEEIITLSHRYFYMKEMLVPVEKIPQLLEENFSEVKYGILTKTLSNHINLFAKQHTGNKISNFVRDRRKLENIQWLELLIDSAKDFEGKTFEQKKTPKLKAKIKNLEYDLKILAYEKGNLLAQGFEYLQEIKAGKKLKTPFQRLKRRYKTVGKRIHKIKNQIKANQIKLQNSEIKAIEMNDLSARMNKLRTYASDWQGLTVNMRLLGSLFELKTHKKLIRIAGKKFEEKYLIEVGKQWTFSEILQSFGFTEQESQKYLAHLKHQIEIDLKKNEAFLSKNSKKSIKSPIDTLSFVGNLSEKWNDSAKGYPEFWD